MITAPSVEERAAWRDQLGAPRAHRVIAADAACLTQVGLGTGGLDVSVTGWMRVAVWNAERLVDAAAAGALLAGADVVLASELDDGMARTDNRDGALCLARALEMSYAFGVEFVELGLGDSRERAALAADAVNERGLHGNAVLARTLVTRAEVVRLDEGGWWFSATGDQPRVGGRMAVVCDVELDGRPITMASVHLENVTDGDGRAAQLEVLLDAIDRRGTDGAIIGGDLNTFGATWEELADRSTVARMRAVEPTRFTWPVAYEPLFARAQARGWEWVDANVAAPTTRHDRDGAPHHVPMKLDWILVRGVEARRPTVIPALGPDGAPLSDHDALAVSVRWPARSSDRPGTARPPR